MSGVGRYLEQVASLALPLIDRGAVLSGEAAAHAHLAVATKTRPGGSALYLALVPRTILAIFPERSADLEGVQRDLGPIAEILRPSLDLFAASVVLSDGTRLPVLQREAVLAQLLAAGGLSIGLAGLMIRLANSPPADVDEIREILKAARMGDRFQPLLELLDVA